MGSEGDHTHGWRKGFDSFGEQWLLLVQHFLLLLCALGFTGGMHRFLVFGFLESIRRYVEPILLVVDVLAIFLFGFLFVAMLAIDVYEKIRLRWRRAQQGVQVVMSQRNLRGIALPESYATGNPGLRSFQEESDQDAQAANEEHVGPSGDESEQPAGITPPESYAAENPGLRAFQEESDQEVHAANEEKAHGTFTKDAVEMSKAVATLGSTHSRFDAVSRCELPFWLRGGDQFADEYFNGGMAIVRGGKIGTRMFLVSRGEFEQGPDLLFKVLLKHQRAGIGFAVVPFRELPPDLRERADDLDFKLWDRGNAYSRFLSEGDYHRKMYIEFSMDGKNGDVADKVCLYKQMLPHAWLVDQNYTDHQKDWIEELGGELKRNNDHLCQRIGKRIAPEGKLYLEVHDEKELQKKVEGLVALWKLTQETLGEEHPSEVTEEPRRGREPVP